MQLIDFNIHSTTLDIQNKSVILLQSKKHSPLLLYRFVKQLQVSSGLEVKKIDLDQDLGDIYCQLQTTFLGQTFLYWFPDLSSISSRKKRADLISYIAAYQGPHQLVGCVTIEEGVTLSNGLIIELQDSYSSDQVIKLTMLYDQSTDSMKLNQKPEITAYFIGKLYRYRKQYSIEQLCMLLDYAGVLGKNSEVFFESWLDQLVISDISLYWVSQLFFEKNAADFFEIWATVRPLYSDQFWTAFFSEQLFKAYWVIVWQARIAPEHKQITFGLPFSFLKQDWKLHRKDVLQQAHQKIYTVDLLLKSGGSTNRLDLFLVQFFQGF